MRKSEGKELGYVLVPLYLEKRAGETLEGAVARTGFDEVWDILQSLKEQDEVLADLIREMSKAKGREKGFTDIRLSDRIEFTGPILSLESLRDSIVARTLEGIQSSWDAMFGKLLEYKAVHGDCRVPIGYKANQQLGRWVTKQRVRHAEGRLSKERISMLEGIGFEWDPHADDWEINFAVLIAYKDECGDCRVPQKYKSHKALGTWVQTQRTRHAEGTLSEDRILRLESIGFPWDPHAKDWEIKFAALILYREEHGDCRVPRGYKPNPALGHWTNTQRILYAEGKLSHDRISRLEGIGFPWDPHAEDWEIKFAALILYREEHGDCRVPRGYKPNPALGNWVGTQRGLYSKGALSRDRVSRLESIGFEWDPRTTDWELQLDGL
jgi:hypothetical protein